VSLRAELDASPGSIRLPYVGLPALLEVTVGFWSFGRRRKDPEQPGQSPPEAAADELAVVELWTAEGRRTVAVEMGGKRMTDVLNGDPILRVVPIHAAEGETPASVKAGPGQVWLDLDIDEVLLAFPPAQLTDPRRRLHRPRQLIELRAGPFEVSGSVSVPPGAQAAGFLFRKGARFEPVTRAVVRDTRFELFEQRAEVVLVNLRRVDVLRDVGLGETPSEATEGTDAGVPEA
jgi:hypothetical protein